MNINGLGFNSHQQNMNINFGRKNRNGEELFKPKKTDKLAEEFYWAKEGERLNSRGELTTEGARKIHDAYNVLNSGVYVSPSSSTPNKPELKKLAEQLPQTAAQQDAIARRMSRHVRMDVDANGASAPEGLDRASKREQTSRRMLLGGTLASEAIKNLKLAEKAKRLSE